MFEVHHEVEEVEEVEVAVDGVGDGVGFEIGCLVIRISPLVTSGVSWHPPLTNCSQML